MTLSDLTALALRETQRQAALAHQAAHDGGVWDPLLGRFVDWNEDGPISQLGRNDRHEANDQPGNTRTTSAGRP